MLLSVGGEALVSCGMMESLLRVINWYAEGQEHITVGRPSLGTHYSVGLSRTVTGFMYMYIVNTIDTIQRMQ